MCHHGKRQPKTALPEPLSNEDYSEPPGVRHGVVCACMQGTVLRIATKYHLICLLSSKYYEASKYNLYVWGEKKTTKIASENDHMSDLIKTSM